MLLIAIPVTTDTPIIATTTTDYSVVTATSTMEGTTGKGHYCMHVYTSSTIDRPTQLCGQYRWLVSSSVGSSYSYSYYY